MTELAGAVARVVAGSPHKITLSAPRAGTAYKRATLRRLPHGWQLERLTDTQAFHENFATEALKEVLTGLLEDEFTQLNAFGEAGGTSLRISKKGKVLVGSTPPTPEKTAACTGGGSVQEHDRKKAAILPEGSVIPPLVDMGVFTQDGRVAAGMYDKYRQVNRFVELVDDALRGSAPKTLRVVDFGCGKSYLTFVLYHYLREVRGIEATITGLDLKADVVANCNRAARRYGYDGLHFAVGDIAGYDGAGADMVVTLHACDTATDLALAHAISWGAGYIFSVPCCQHELNAQMQPGALPILSRYGLVQERVAALMTDALRANLLTACGYKTAVVEFVELAHTPKNILLRARRAAIPPAKRRAALAEAEQLCAAFGFAPSLLRLLQEKGILD